MLVRKITESKILTFRYFSLPALRNDLWLKVDIRHDTVNAKATFTNEYISGPTRINLDSRGSKSYTLG